MEVVTIDLKNCNLSKDLTEENALYVSMMRSLHHLMIHCDFASKMWSAILKIFEMEWVMPRSVDDLFLHWRWGCKYGRGKILWKFVLYATFWKIWLERNNRVFRKVSKPVEKVIESIVWTVSVWVCK